MAEREGFEPPVPLGITGFQDQRHKPLGHLSSLLEPAELLYDSPVSLSSPFFLFHDALPEGGCQCSAQRPLFCIWAALLRIGPFQQAGAGS